MKRICYFLLAMLMLTLAFLPSCGETAPQTAPETFEEAEKEPTVQDVMTKMLKADQVTSLPIANEDMTKDELRQLVLDYFELQLSFHWIPDMDLKDYPTTYFKKSPKTIDMGTVYGGIPYQSTGTGNLYRWLEYYDEETGVFQFSKALAENGGYGEGAAITDVKKDAEGNVTYKKYQSLKALFNQCSVASFWGWGRVINSANFIWTSDMNVYNGFIPVGCYTYGYEHNGKFYGPAEIKRFGEKDNASNDNGNPTGYDTKHVISDWKKSQNDKEAMYKCYAQMKPGDCVVSGGHAMMVKKVNLFYREDGTISYPLSTAIMIEQIEGWGKQGVIGEEGNKYPFKNQGGVDREYSFGELQNSRYIPFTFAEYLDPEDPQDKKHLDYYLSYAEKLHPLAKRYGKSAFSQSELAEMTGIGVEKAFTFSSIDPKEKKSLTYAEFVGMYVGSNYPISDCFVVVKDKDGKELLKNIFRSTSAMMREITMKAGKSTWEYDEAGNRLPISHGVEALANGENTVEISLQLSTGEKLIAYSGTLMPQG